VSAVVNAAETETEELIEEEQPSPPAHRMGIALFALVGLLIAGYLLLYKFKVLSSIACGTGGCEVVQSSPWAMFLGIPVPAWGVGGYLAMLVLALLGLQPRFVNSRGLATVLFLTATLAFGFSMYLTALEAFRIHAWCRWCVGSAVVATLIFAVSLLELPLILGRKKS
jgi:uncharacterized membrane protein